MNERRSAARRPPLEETMPYERLAAFGVAPESAAREVLDASFEMTPAQLADPELRGAWEDLRTSRTRLFVDFFLVDLPDEATAAGGADAAAPLPLPWAFLQRLAAKLPDFDGNGVDER